MSITLIKKSTIYNFYKIMVKHTPFIYIFFIINTLLCIIQLCKILYNINLGTEIDYKSLINYLFIEFIYIYIMCIIYKDKLRETNIEYNNIIQIV